jgi:hypothetical protein
MQLGLKANYDVLSKYIPFIYKFFFNRLYQHEEWKVATAVINE